MIELLQDAIIFWPEMIAEDLVQVKQKKEISCWIVYMTSISRFHFAFDWQQYSSVLQLKDLLIAGSIEFILENS